MKNHNSIVTVTIIVIAAKLVAFLKEFVISYFFGVSAMTDAYSIAYTIPITIIGFVAVGINTSYIPIYNRARTEKDEDAAFKFSNSVISLVFWIACITFVTIMVFAPQIVRIFAAGFDEDTVRITALLTRYMAASVFFLCYNRVVSAYLQLKNRYYIVTLCEIILYGISIVGIIAGFYWKIEYMSIGVLIGYMLESLVLTIVAIRRKYYFSIPLIPKDTYLKQLVLLIIPVLIGNFASDINKVIGKTIASLCQEGAISVLNYAGKIDEAIISIFVTSLVAVAYPKLSDAVSSGKMDRLQIQVRNDLVYMLALTLPVIGGIIIFSKEIVTLLFVRGAFSAEDAVLVSNAFLIYTLGMIPTSFRKYFVRIYYSFANSKTPAVNSTLIVVLNIVLSLVLSRAWGLYGIAASSSISITIGMLHLVVNVKKMIKIDCKPLVLPVCKLVFAATVMAVWTRVLYNSLSGMINANLLLIGCILVACVIYFGLLWAMKMKYLLVYLKK